SGKWPDRTMFVLEIRSSATQGSINRAGFFQADLVAVEANVKDSRLPGGWGFFDFGREQVAKAPLPTTAACYTCHAANTAVEHTFVQFYPDLMAVARRFGTVKPGYRPDAH
ncbi:MAG: cytochrome P460 family protein, partial [Vicinamibacterales bacterium]